MSIITMWGVSKILCSPFLSKKGSWKQYKRNCRPTGAEVDLWQEHPPFDFPVQGKFGRRKWQSMKISVKYAFFPPAVHRFSSTSDTCQVLRWLQSCFQTTLIFGSKQVKLEPQIISVFWVFWYSKNNKWNTRCLQEYIHVSKSICSFYVFKSIRFPGCAEGKILPPVVSLGV